MTDSSLTVRVDEMMNAALREIAGQEDMSVGQIVRDAISRDLRRREKAKRNVRSDERLVAPLRSLLADDLAWSKDWGDLQVRLAAKGYQMKEAGGGLILARSNDGAKVCKASDLGCSHARLARRFGRPFLGHRQAWLVARQI